MFEVIKFSIESQSIIYNELETRLQAPKGTAVETPLAGPMNAGISPDNRIMNEFLIYHGGF